MDEKEFERAAWLTDLMREDGLWQVRKALQSEQDPDHPTTDCADCGNEIPPERLKLGRIRCIECQKVKEFQEKMKGC